MRLIDADALLARVDEEREYLKARGLFGAEHILTKDFRNLVEDAPTVEMESPVIKINVPKEDIQRLLEELQKPQKVLVLPEPEVEPVRPQGEWELHGMIYYCSNCGHYCGESGDNFCGNCGADMRGEE